MNRILVFNPYFRISVDEALNHAFFKKVRKQEKEVCSDKEIFIEFEKEHLDRKKLRQLFLEEVEFYKTMRKQQVQVSSSSNMSNAPANAVISQ